MKNNTRKQRKAKKMQTITVDSGTLRRAADLMDEIAAKQAEVNEILARSPEINQIKQPEIVMRGSRKYSPESINRIRSAQKRRWRKQHQLVALGLQAQAQAVPAQKAG